MGYSLSSWLVSEGAAALERQSEGRIAPCLPDLPDRVESRGKRLNRALCVGASLLALAPGMARGKNLRASRIDLGKGPRKSRSRPDRQKGAACRYRSESAGFIIPVSIPRQLVIGAFMNLRVAG
jgi:hypothetical protein